MTDTHDLNASLEDTRRKTQALNDSLKTLASEGFDGLARAVGQAATSARAAKARDDAGTIATKELAGFLRQELAAGLATAFGGSGGGRGFSVVIHNNTPSSVTATQADGGFDMKTLEITIDQMVAGALSRGTETTSLLRGLFGLVPGLIGR